MQQLAASVRVQGHKPPLALMGWLSELNNNNNTAPEGGTVAAAPHGVAASNKHKDEVVTSNNNNPTSLSSIQTNSSGCGCSSGSNGSHSRSLPATLPRSRSHSSFENLIKTTPTTASSPKRALTTTTTSSSCVEGTNSSARLKDMSAKCSAPRLWERKDRPAFVKDTESSA